MVPCRIDVYLSYRAHKLLKSEELKQMRLDAQLTHSELALFVFSDKNESSLVKSIEDGERSLSLIAKAKWFYICSQQVMKNAFAVSEEREPPRTALARSLSRYYPLPVFACMFFVYFYFSTNWIG